MNGSTNEPFVQKARKRLGWGWANNSGLNAFLGLMTYVYSEYPDRDDASYKEGMHLKSMHLSQGAHLLQACVSCRCALREHLPLTSVHLANVHLEGEGWVIFILKRTYVMPEFGAEGTVGQFVGEGETTLGELIFCSPNFQRLV